MPESNPANNNQRPVVQDRQNYLFDITDANVTVSRAGNERLSCKFVVAAGPDSGAVVYDEFPLRSNFPPSMAFIKERIADFANACGQTKLGDVRDDYFVMETYVGKTVKAQTYQKPDWTGTDGEKREGQMTLKNFKAVTGNRRGSTSAPTAAPAVSQADDGNVPF